MYLDDPLNLGLDWIRARLSHHPRTRHLNVRVSSHGETVVLEGWASTLTDKHWAGRITRNSQAKGSLDNRIQVAEEPAGGLPVPQWLRGIPQREVMALAA